MGLRGIIQVLVILHVINNLNATRKISGGHPLSDGGESLVYFVKSERSPRSYSGWICGGTLVTEIYIITSAACIEDVPYLYAIMGYRVYVPAEELDKDPCTKEMKKKVVYTCVPKAYELDYGKVEKWSAIDIGVAKLESSITPDNKKYAEICSYTPLFIQINYDLEYEKPDLGVVISGWGHRSVWRQPGDHQNYNQKHAQTAWTQILNKTVCMQQYTDFPKLLSIIDKYMICTNETGHDQNSKRRKKRRRKRPYSRVRLKKKRNRKSSDLTLTNNNTNIRRQGICQNDHGIPLGGVVGKTFKLLGVASVFRVNNNSLCEGPYLFTSTACNKDFLRCVIEPKQTRKNSICDKSPRERGFDMIHRYISWTNHTDGPTDIGMIKMRPQIPLHYFG